MGEIIKDNKLVIITKIKTIHFSLTNNFGNYLKLKIDFIIKHNEF